jgi:hypothetical protein
LLSFDLQTNCSNGIARYTGNISYKLSTDKIYGPSTRIDGKLTTNLLAWDQRYDFKVSYKGVDYVEAVQLLEENLDKTVLHGTFFGIHNKLSLMRLQLVTKI